MSSRMRRIANFRYRPGAASLSQIDRRTKVGSDAWFRKHSIPALWLSAWRRSHMFPAKTAHGPVRHFARGRGLKPSSRMSVKHNLEFQAKKLDVPRRASDNTVELGRRVHKNS